MAIYAQGEEDRELLRAHLASSGRLLHFWSSNEGANPAEQWVVDKSLFFALGERVVIVLGGMESLSFLFTGLRLVVEAKLEHLSLVGVDSLDRLPIASPEDRLAIEGAMRDGRLRCYRDVQYFIVGAAEDL